MSTVSSRRGPRRPGIAHITDDDLHTGRAVVIGGGPEGHPSQRRVKIGDRAGEVNQCVGRTVARDET